MPCLLPNADKCILDAQRYFSFHSFHEDYNSRSAAELHLEPDDPCADSKLAPPWHDSAEWNCASQTAVLARITFCASMKPKRPRCPRDHVAMKLLNDPGHAVTEMLEGLVSCVEHLNRLDSFPEVLTRRVWSKMAPDPSYCRYSI